jgi:hypothetical protein
LGASVRSAARKVTLRPSIEISTSSGSTPGMGATSTIDSVVT